MKTSAAAFVTVLSSTLWFSSPARAIGSEASSPATISRTQRSDASRIEQMLRLTRSAAEGGDRDAMNYLGVLLATGTMVARDPDLAAVTSATRRSDATYSQRTSPAANDAL